MTRTATGERRIADRSNAYLRRCRWKYKYVICVALDRCTSDEARDQIMEHYLKTCHARGLYAQTTSARDIATTFINFLYNASKAAQPRHAPFVWQRWQNEEGWTPVGWGMNSRWKSVKFENAKGAG